METIYIKTPYFLEEFAQADIKSIIGIKPEKIEDCMYSFEIEFDELFNVVYKLINLSRTISKIYMKKIHTIYGEYNFLKDTIKIKGKNVEVFDLSSNILDSREYLIHHNSDSISHHIVNYCLFKLNIHKKRTPYTIMNPISNYSSTIIESASFNPRKPIHEKERYEMQIFRELKKFIKKIPKFEKIKDTNKYISIVNSDKAFKKSKENLSKSNLSIKISKLELEWIDLKYEKGDIDYILTLLPIYKNEEENKKFLHNYFNMIRYLCKGKMCIITRIQINKSYFTKNSLKLEEEVKINDDIITYYIYILK